MIHPVLNAHFWITILGNIIRCESGPYPCHDFLENGNVLVVHFLRASFHHIRRDSRLRFVGFSEIGRRLSLLYALLRLVW